jgi:hypothetical protein
VIEQIHALGMQAGEPYVRDGKPGKPMPATQFEKENSREHVCTSCH